MCELWYLLSVSHSDWNFSKISVEHFVVCSIFHVNDKNVSGADSVCEHMLELLIHASYESGNW